MRNRVSFSYVGKYDISYQAYSNTIFFDYCKDESHDTGDIYKNKVKYTYIGKPSWSYVHHDVGTSYVHIDSNTDTLTLYENEYDRQKYVIIDNSLSTHSNNQKEKIVKTINVDDPSKELPIQESICTYINISNITGASYTMFPNFVEGITGYEYQIYKLAYGASTNNMTADGPILDFKNQNSYGTSIKKGDKDVSYNIRGTYCTSGNEYVRINGVGFEVMTGDTVMLSSVEYTDILKVYVYDELNNLIKDEDLYKHLFVTLPGVENNAYSTRPTNDGVYLSINDNNKHVGMVLVKMSLDWKNNKFTVYHNFNFGTVVDKLKTVTDLKYAVNKYAASDVNKRRDMLLEGDQINVTYLKTNPERANGKIRLKIIDTTLISKSYNGIHEKNDSSARLREYYLGTSYTIKKVFDSNNGIYTTLGNILNYNDSGSGNTNSETLQTWAVKVFRFVPNKNSIKFSYKTSDNNYSEFPSGNITVSMSENKNIIKGNFNIACSDNVNQSRYTFPIKKNGDYNNFEVKLNYQSQINNPTASSSIPINGNLDFNTALSYNSYSFTYTVTEPGKYTFIYYAKNGNVINQDTIKSFDYSQLINDGQMNITTYEGTFAYHLLSTEQENMYAVNENSVEYINYINFGSGVDIHNNTDVNNDTVDFGFLNSSHGNNNLKTIQVNFVDKQNNFRQLVKNFTINIQKFKVKTFFKVRNSAYQSIGDFVFPNTININSDKSIPLLDLASHNSETIDFEIKSYLFLETDNDYSNPSEACSNFELRRTSEIPSNGWMQDFNTSFNDNILTTTFKINKSAWDYTHNYETFYYNIKLDKKNNKEYWDNLGFNNALLNYKFTIVNSKVESHPESENILLFTNVVNNASTPTLPPTNKYYYDLHTGYITDSSSITELLFYVYDNDNNMWFEEGIEKNDLNEWHLGFTVNYVVLNNNGYLEITPTYNDNINKYISLKVIPKSGTNTSYSYIKIWLRSAKIALQDLNSVKYISDIYDSNMTLYQEILLNSSGVENSSPNDNTFIKKFCDINVDNSSSLLHYYSVKNSSIILFIKETINGETYSNNVPDGIKYDIVLTNLIYDNNEKVLIPVSKENVSLKLKHNNNDVINQTITMNELTVDNDWLFTNGKQQ